MNIYIAGFRIRFLGKNRIRGSVPLDKSFLILDNFKINLVCFHTFGVRRPIDVLDPE